MTNFTLKQVTPAGSDLHIVTMGSDIVHDTIADRLTVVKDQAVLKAYDLSLGTVFMMNDTGRTIEKYERSKNKPVVDGQPTASLTADPLSPIFTFNDKRYITIGNLTYRLPKGKTLQLTAINNYGIMLATTRLEYNTALAKDANLLKVFPHQYNNIANILVGDGLVLEEFAIRHTDDFIRYNSDRYLSNDEKLQLFGVNFNPSPDLVVYLKGKYYTCGMDGTMHLLSDVGAK